MKLDEVKGCKNGSNVSARLTASVASADSPTATGTPDAGAPAPSGSEDDEDSAPGSGLYSVSQSMGLVGAVLALLAAIAQL